MRIQSVILNKSTIDNYAGIGKLSLVKFFDFLVKTDGNAASEHGVFVSIAKDLIEKTLLHTEPINTSNLIAYESVFQLIYSLSVAATSDNRGRMWAIGDPTGEKALYGTNGFYDLCEKDIFEQPVKELFPTVGKISNRLRLFYELIFQRFYGVSKTSIKTIIFEEKDADDNTINYYDLHIDFQFVDIAPKGPLPVLDFKSCTTDEAGATLFDWKRITESINIEDFEMRGFTMLSFEKTTLTHIVAKLRDMIAALPHYDSEHFIIDLERILKPIFQENKNVYSLFPLFHLNGRPMISPLLANKSLILPDNESLNDAPPQEILDYFKNPYPIFYNTKESIQNSQTVFDEKIRDSGVKSYLCIPLLHNNILSGLLEVYSFARPMLTDEEISALQTLVPLLSQLSHDVSTEIKRRLDEIIIKRFTSIQPAVQWKFNHVAALYLKNQEEHQQTVEIQPVIFQNVYPLYGAIDVKDSTDIRNRSILKDFSFKLKKLGELIDHLSKNHPDATLLHDFSSHLEHVSNLFEELSFDEFTLKITEFFRKDVNVFLKHASTQFPKQAAFIQFYSSEYFVSNGEEREHYRKEFECSLQLLNQLIGQELERFNNFIQGNYPSYFQKFRTDGIEYDLYVGQSITPQEKFSPTIIKIFRRTQLLSMATIAIEAYRLKSGMPIPLETTQLIFINPQRIDIRFREDERRFDVEGSINIRYEIIKKRIDKIHIKDTGERLTQYKKIAIVYLSDNILEELYENVQAIRDLGMITDQIEQLRLEDLQGVSGLKAIRLTIDTTYQQLS